MFGVVNVIDPDEDLELRVLPLNPRPQIAHTMPAIGVAGVAIGVLRELKRPHNQAPDHSRKLAGGVGVWPRIPIPRARIRIDIVEEPLP